MFYIRLALIGMWMSICCIIGIAKAILTLRWGDTRLGMEYARLFAKGAYKISGINMEYEGLEHVEATQPCIYTLNHQSNFDMAIFGEVYPGNAVIIGKKELVWIPLFGLFYAAAGNIMIDRSKTDKAKSSLSQVVEQIKKRNVCVWVFPEGTRNSSETKLLPFKKGPFHMAVAAQIPVVPIVSSSLADVINWDKKHMPGGRVKVRILPPIFTTGMTDSDVTNLTETVYEKMQTAFSELNEAVKK